MPGETLLSDLLMLGNDHMSKKSMKEQDDKRKYFNPMVLSQQDCTAY